jgi:hypothetical protein
MTINLSVSRLVNVDVVITPTGARSPNLSTLLVFDTSTVIDVVTRKRTYNTLAELAVDFDANSEAYKAAAIFFDQRPSPTQIQIGRWAKTASAGQLYGGVLSAADQTLANFTGIDDGEFKIAVDGGGAADVGPCDFTGAANLNAVAAIITTALGGGKTCVWNASLARFIITSATTGAASSISFMTAPAAGTDISALLKGRAADGGYRADGVAAQTALATLELFDNQFAGQFYAVFFPGITVDADHEAVAGYIEGLGGQHFYWVGSTEAGCIDPASTTDIMYVLKQLNYEQTAVQYSSTNINAVMSLAAIVAVVDWNGNNTALTLMYKQEPGVVAESLTATQADAIQAKNGNVYVNYANGTAIVQTGVTPSGQFIDTIVGVNWLAGSIQSNVFNLLYTLPKVPQTDDGMNAIATQIEAACAQGVVNGLVAPGVWNAGGFGQLKQGDWLDKGFYIYAPPVASQNEADRAARKSVSFQVAAKLAGAVHTVLITVYVNQ